jgi:hypothetical protein
MNERVRKEREGLVAEVAFAAGFSDADRIRILREGLVAEVAFATENLALRATFRIALATQAHPDG